MRAAAALCCPLLPAVAASAAGADPATVRIDPATGRWEEPWRPQGGAFNPYNSLGPEDMENLEEWGFNAVRLGVMWPGSKADLLSRHFCGEGVPEFYVEALLRNKTSRVGAQPAFPVPVSSGAMALNATGYPALADCLKQPSFSNFYQAQRLLNEPSAECLDGADGPQIGPLVGCKSLPELGSKPMNEYMAPLYRAAAAEIRKADPSRPILYEAQPQPLIFSPPFDALPLGDDGRGWKHLDPRIEMNFRMIHAGIGPGLECEAAQDVYTKEFYGFLDKYPHLGGFMTEFGAVGPSAREMKHLDRLLKLDLLAA
eukprot:gene16768-11247_t